MRKAFFLVCLSILVFGSSLSYASVKTGSSESQAAQLRMGTAQIHIDSINPFVAVNSNALAAFRNIYPYLLQYNRRLRLAPDFAVRWQPSNGGKTWTFWTRTNAKWSDGQPLTASDVAWTFNTILKHRTGAAAGLANFLLHVKSVTAPRSDRVVVRYSTPVGNALAQLSSVPVLPRHIWAPHAVGAGAALRTFSNGPPVVSGGPFILTDFRRLDITRFERNPNYYARRPQIEAFGLKDYASFDAMVLALKNDDLDWAQSIQPTAVPNLTSDRDLRVTQTPGLVSCEIGVNSHSKKGEHRELLDQRVRLALATALDLRRMVRVVTANTGQRAASMVPPASGAWHNRRLSPVPYNVGRANAILDAAGYARGSDGIRVANGSRMRYEMVYLTSPPFPREFQIIRANWRAIGIELNPAPTDGAGYVPALKGAKGDWSEFDFNLDCWTTQVDPDFILSQLTCAQLKSFTETAYCSKEYDALYRRQGTLTNLAARRTVVWRMQELLFRDRPYILLYHPQNLEASSREWTGFERGPQAQGFFNFLSKDNLLAVRKS